MLSQFRNEEFFRLKTDNKNDVGYPYVNYYCDFKAGILIAGGSTYSINIPWDAQSWNRENPFFTTEFATASSDSFYFKGKLRYTVLTIKHYPGIRKG